MNSELKREGEWRQIIENAADSVVPLMNGLFLTRKRYRIKGETLGVRAVAEVGQQIVRGIRSREEGIRGKVVELVSRNTTKAAGLRREADIEVIKGK